MYGDFGFSHRVAEADVGPEVFGSAVNKGSVADGGRRVC
jgi:hypothetical protein